MLTNEPLILGKRVETLRVGIGGHSAGERGWYTW